MSGWSTTSTVSQGLLYLLHQERCRKGLLQEASQRRPSMDQVVLQWFGAHHDDGCRPACKKNLNRAQKSQRIHAWSIQIDQDQIRLRLVDHLQRMVPTDRFLHCESHGFKIRPDQLANAPIALHSQYTLLIHTLILSQLLLEGRKRLVIGY